MPKALLRLLTLLLPVMMFAGCGKQPSDTTSTPESSTAAINEAPKVNEPPAASDTSLSTDQQKYSYALGVQLGQNIANQSLDLDQNALTQGINDMVSNGTMKLSQPEMEQAVANYEAQEQKRLALKAGENLAAGEAFLAANKKNAHVTETASGLQYKILTKGTGAQPKVSDSVVVHYRGTFIDGKEFDSSYSRGEPITISLSQVIPAWQEVLPMMPVGSKWQVYIPSKLGYGENASGPIEPNSTLIFDVELLSIAQAPAAATTPAP